MFSFSSPFALVPYLQSLLPHSILPALFTSVTQHGPDQRADIIKSLKGKRVLIPDLHSLFPSWPEATNPELDGLRKDVEKTLNVLFSDDKRRQKLLAADAGLFGAMWWPYANFERLCMATYLSIWLFAWDDETDSEEFSELATDFEKASAFRELTLFKTRQYLGLEVDSGNIPGYIKSNGTHTSILAQFKPVGDEMKKHCTIQQRERLMKQIDFFVKMSRVEQEVQLNSHLPSVESYMSRRMGTSAVTICLAIHEYTLGISLPNDTLECEAMRSLWDATNRIISISNDIISVKKEVAQDQIDSLIPLLYIRHNRDVQAAVDDATFRLTEATQHFEAAATTLLNHHAADKPAKDGLEAFIDSCRYACTANLNWSLQSGRYGLKVESLRNGYMMEI